MKSSFEEFTQNVMHPLESSSGPGSARVPVRNQIPELEPLPPPHLKQTVGVSGSSIQSRLLPHRGRFGSEAIDSHRGSTRRSHSPRPHQLLSSTWSSASPAWYSPHPRRPRANTNEDRQTRYSKSGEFAETFSWLLPFLFLIQSPSLSLPPSHLSTTPASELHRDKLPRNHSVPERLNRIHKRENITGVETTPPSSLSASGTNLRRPINIRRHRTASPSPTSRAPPTVVSPTPEQSETS